MTLQERQLEKDERTVRSFLECEPFRRDALYAPDDPQAGHMVSRLNAWIDIVNVLNELARSMGQPDFYPFVLSKPVVAKLQLVQRIATDARTNPIM